MTIAFVYDPPAWNDARVRWTIATLAPLLDASWRELVAEGDWPRADEVLVYVGEAATAPPGCAAVIPSSEWPALTAATMERAQWDGAPLATPGGQVTMPAAAHELPPEWLPSLWHALAREEEREEPRRDQWGCFSGAYARLGAIGLLETPWVDQAVAALRGRLDAWCATKGATLERVPRWKNGARFAVALSHDVDDVRLRSTRQAMRLLILARRPTSYAARGGLSALARGPSSSPDPYAQFERWTEEESQRGFRSTFFAFARPAAAHELDALYELNDPVPFEGARPTVAAMLRTLAGRGFEIGLHGSYDSWKSAEALGAQRAALGEATGADVRSTRQHYLRLDLQPTWDAQEAAGITADATLGYNEAIGFRAGISTPFHPWDAKRERGRTLLELPLTVMDGALFRGMGLTTHAAIQRTIGQLEAVAEVNGMAGLLWHPNVAAESLFPGWWTCFAAALDHLAARGAWVTSVGEIAAWWRERETRLAGGVDPWR